MTSKHPCGGDAAHAKYDQARTTIEALADEITAAQRPAEKAGRSMTPAETARIDRTRAAFEEARTELRKTRREVEDHHVSRGCGAASPSDGAPPKSTGSSEMDQLWDNMINRRSSSTQGGAKARRDTRWSVKAFEQMARGSAWDAPAKSLAAPGSVIVPASFDPAVIREGERPLSVRELIPTEVITTNTFGYLRQVVRTLNAAPVAPGDLKPTSIVTTERIEERTRTVAHVSEPIFRQDLADSSDLGAFIDQELRYGVLAATESQILNGDGQGENITGILATAGTSVQPFAQDVFVTTRKALTLLQQQNIIASAWLMSPSDWEGFELSRETSPSAGGFLLTSSPIDRSAQRLWGLPVITSPIVPTGTAVLGRWDQARVYQRQDTEVLWSDATYYAAANGDPVSSGFARNTVVMRAEERVGLGVLQPAAFVEVDLTAA